MLTSLWKRSLMKVLTRTSSPYIHDQGNPSVEGLSPVVLLGEKCAIRCASPETGLCRKTIMQAMQEDYHAGSVEASINSGCTPLQLTPKSKKCTTGARLSAIALRKGISIDAWVICIVHQYSKMKKLTHELKQYRWDIMGPAEVRWTVNILHKRVKEDNLALPRLFDS